MVDPRRMDEKRPLDADPVGCKAAHGEVLVDAAPSSPDHDSFKDLDPLTSPLDDLRVDSNGVARPEWWDITLELL